MRITPDLVAACPQFTNPLREREIKLRACKIPAIENLGATQDQFDTIDLSDNEIRKLEVPPPAGCTCVGILRQLTSAGAWGPASGLGQRAPGELELAIHTYAVLACLGRISRC